MQEEECQVIDIIPKGFFFSVRVLEGNLWEELERADQNDGQSIATESISGIKTRRFSSTEHTNPNPSQRLSSSAASPYSRQATYPLRTRNNQRIIYHSTPDKVWNQTNRLSWQMVMIR